jgi:integrase
LHSSTKILSRRIIIFSGQESDSVGSKTKRLDRNLSPRYYLLMKSLTRSELAGLREQAKQCSELDELMILVMFNHGLRVSEAINLDSSNIQGDYIVVQRLKNSKKTSQPLMGDEKEALKSLAAKPGKFFPMCRMTAWRKIQKYGKAANIPEHKLHPHVLKHTAGKLAHLGGMGLPEIQCWLGHKNGGNTMKYMEATEDEAALAFAAAVGK